VLTLHQPLHVDGPLMLSWLLDGIEAMDGHVPVVFPLPPSLWPRVAGHELVQEAGNAPRGSRKKRLLCIDPLDYVDSIALLSTARVVLTDSGDVQDETTLLGVPCLTLRDATERSETVTYGTNRVIGTDPARIAPEVLQSLNDSRRPPPAPLLWDGRTASRIVETLVGRQIVAGEATLSLGVQANGR